MNNDISLTTSTLDPVAYYLVYVRSFSFLIALVIGIIASVLVIQSARKMGGGLFGSVLNFMGLGMLAVVLGTISVGASDWLPVGWASLVHTVLFSSGYILMVLGAHKLLKGIMAT